MGTSVSSDLKKTSPEKVFFCAEIDLGDQVLSTCTETPLCMKTATAMKRFYDRESYVVCRHWISPRNHSFVQRLNPFGPARVNSDWMVEHFELSLQEEVLLEKFLSSHKK